MIQIKPNAENTQHTPQLQHNPQTQEDSINPDVFSDRIHLWQWKWGWSRGEVEVLLFSALSI